MMNIKRFNVDMTWKNFMLSTMIGLLLSSLNAHVASGRPLLNWNHDHSILSGDTITKPSNSSYGKAYEAKYHINPAYTPEGKRALSQWDSVQNAGIIADMSKDGLIKAPNPWHSVLTIPVSSSMAKSRMKKYFSVIKENMCLKLEKVMSGNGVIT